MELQSTLIAEGYRRCTCCGKVKPVEEFNKQSYTGLPTNQCTQCINIKRGVKRNKLKHSKFISVTKQRTGEIPELSLEDWQAVMVYFDGACAYCGKKQARGKANQLDRDHVVPVSHGGKTTKFNMVPACTKCNRGRGNKEWLEWYAKQPFYDRAKAEKILKWIGGGTK